MAKLLLHITLTFIGLYAHGQNTQPEQLADKLSTAFNTNNVEAYKKLMLDSADFALFTQTFAGKKDMQGVIDTAKKHFTKEADAANTREFGRLMSEGIRLGINWTLVSKGRFVYNEDSTTNSNYTSLMGYLKFTFNDKPYSIAGIEAIRLPQGYKIISIAKVLRGNIARYIEPHWSEE